MSLAMLAFHLWEHSEVGDSKYEIIIFFNKKNHPVIIIIILFKKIKPSAHSL